MISHIVWLNCMQDTPICDHPMSDIIVAGKAAAQLPETFHSLLQTISDVMMLLPMGSALQVGNHKHCRLVIINTAGW